MSSYRGRFAPSPTGDLHVGSAAAALIAWLAARQASGALLLRIEDIDTARVVPGATERQIDDLRWLGLDWDEGPDMGGPHRPYVQSARTQRYEDALRRLAEGGHLYYCDCSRAEIARIASAPHPGDEGPRYPGTCRPSRLASRAFKRPPAIRLAVPEGEVALVDRFQGELVESVHAVTGDFVLKRGDGAYAYQLAVVVDDLAMEITEVVRGADLLASAPRQALLAALLGGRAPGFAHVPLVLASDGARLAKRAPGASLRDHRAAGRSGEAFLADLARVLGLLPPDDPRREVSARGLLDVPLDRLHGRSAVRLPLGWSAAQ